MKKVALVGTAPSGRSAPFNDPSWEIWGCGLRAEYVTRATRWFELHRLDGEPPEWAAEWRRLVSLWEDTELWMFYPEPALSKKPVIELNPAPLVARYGSFFMTSTFSWMMAQAMEEGAEAIGLWGVDMEYGTEYRQQRTGLRHFIELAKLVGIDVQRVVTSGIAYEPIPYPMWQDDPILAKNKLRQKVISENKETADFTSRTMEIKLQQYEGARQEMQTLLHSEHTAVRELAEKRSVALERAVASIREGMLSARDDAMRADGALQELKWLEDYLQP